MARIAEMRVAAQPASDQQRERRRRIIRAASTLAAERDLDQVQMQDVAREAKVAIATLYRYFPSKTHLFMALLRRQIDRLSALAEQSPPPPAGQSPVDAVADLLVAAQRELLERPTLAESIITAANVANGATITDAVLVDHAFFGLVLRTAGIAEPTESDVRVVRLLVLCWFGVLTTTLAGRLKRDDAEADIRRACALLLADLGAPTPASRETR